MAGWNTSAAAPLASGTSPTTSHDRCSRPADSGRGYTLECEEPQNLRHDGGHHLSYDSVRHPAQKPTGDPRMTMRQCAINDLRTQ